MDRETRAAITNMIIELRDAMRPLAWYDADIQEAQGYMSETIDILQHGGGHISEIKEPLTAAGHSITHALDRYSGDNLQLENISRAISATLKLLD